MAQLTRMGIIGAGWPGAAHARGCMEAGGFKVVAVADLIPQRRKQVMADTGATREAADAAAVIEDREIDAVSICLPNHLHAPIAIAALRSGKHVIIETPPALTAKEARQIAATAAKAAKIVLYAFQRRFGGAEQAARQAVVKAYAGDLYHARAAWTRTRGIPAGTGWFTDKSTAGGGSLIDIGIHMLDLAWHLLGQPRPASVYAAVHQKFASQSRGHGAYNVDDSAFALLRFEGGRSLELAASWALNQPPQQQGIVCRLHGDKGVVDVYTPNGAVLYRGFSTTGESKASPLKPPRVTGHAAMMRHFRDCINGKASPSAGPNEGLALMQMIDAMYRSAATGKSVDLS
jgi:predicted dehydrogenase